MAKRLVDLMIGTLLAVLALPMIAVCAVGVAISLRAQPFFLQRRVGRDGRIFWLLKLRTLPPHTPRYADKYTLGEMRLPRFPALLRRLHLDELPQLFLVPLGKMSLVGPRPEMPMLHHRMPERFARRRTSVRPGCTGLWQIGPCSAGLIHEAPVYDQFYLDHRSLRLDLWVVARTIRLLFGGGGIANLREVPPRLCRGGLTVVEAFGDTPPVRMPAMRASVVK